jgi:hypothetical protein
MKRRIPTNEMIRHLQAEQWAHCEMCVAAAMRLKELQDAVDRFVRMNWYRTAYWFKTLKAGSLLKLASKHSSCRKPACRRRFSLCLDCEEHNGCERYRQHRMKMKP